MFLMVKSPILNEELPIDRIATGKEGIRIRRLIRLAQRPNLSAKHNFVSPNVVALQTEHGWYIATTHDVIPAKAENCVLRGGSLYKDGKPLAIERKRKT